MHIINTLAPVFLIIILGAVLKRTGFIGGQLVSVLNRLVYWVALPVLLFYEVAIASYNFHSAGKTFAVVFVGMLGSIAAGYIAAALMKIPAVSVGAFVQGAFRGNLMYIGLPIIIYSFFGSSDSDRMGNIAALVLGFIVPIYNIAAVIVLLAGRHKIDKYIFGRIIQPVITNPFFIACIAGLLYSAASLPMPLALGRTFVSIGQMALPLALIAIGATLADTKIAQAGSAVIVCSLIKVVVSPLVGFVFALLLQLAGRESRVALIYLACPTAVVSYVFAEQLKGDAKMAAAVVFISTVLSVFSLGAVLAIFR